MARFSLNGILLDPIAQERDLVTAGLVSPDAKPKGQDFILIQTKRPIEPKERTTLKSRGVVIKEYFHENTYLCHYPKDDLAVLRALPFVLWADIYFYLFKLPSYFLSSSHSRVDINIIDAKNLYGKLPPFSGKVQLQIALDKYKETGPAA